MFSSAVNADRVLTKAYTYLPYGLPTGDRPYDKLGVNILEAITDLHYSFRNNMSDGPVNLYYNGALSSNIGTSDLQGREAYRFGSEPEYNAIRYAGSISRMRTGFRILPPRPAGNAWPRRR